MSWRLTVDTPHGADVVTFESYDTARNEFIRAHRQHRDDEEPFSIELYEVDA